MSEAPSFGVRTALGPFLLNWSPALNLTPSNATDTPTTPSAPVMDYERLDVFRVALEFTTLVPALTKTARPAMRDQLERAAASVCLNLAEGCGRRARRDRLHFFSIAQGSAMECAAAVDILRALRQTSHEDATSAKHKIARVVQMLVGLRRR